MVPASAPSLAPSGVKASAGADADIALAPPTTPQAALPVAIDVRGRLAEVVRRDVEGALGWQPVDEATSSLVPPLVRLADVDAPGGDATPVVLLVTPDDEPAAAAAATLRLRPAGVVAWPGPRDELVAVVGRATAAPLSTTSTSTTLRIGGAAGGAGATTVALALTGLLAWGGTSTLLASGDRLLLPDDAPTITPDALSAPDLWARAAGVVGVPDARAVRTITPPYDVSLTDPAIDMAVVDLGVADDVDVLVLRPDAPGLAALERTAAAAVVVVGEGPVPQRALAQAIGGRRRIVLPWSARVARAAVVGRVPNALPGRFVRSLLPLTPSRGPD